MRRYRYEDPSHTRWRKANGYDVPNQRKAGAALRRQLMREISHALSAPDSQASLAVVFGIPA